jgi:hemolysin D
MAWGNLLGRSLSVTRAALAAEREIVKPRRSRTELEFLPAALEITETPASPLQRGIALAIVALLLLALAWSWFGKVDVVAVAPGKIIPAGKVKVIQPIELGVVRAIHVVNGQHVRQGDTLVELDPTTAGADRERLTRELAAARLDAARLRAAANGRYDAAAFQPPPELSATLVRQHHALLLAQVQEYEAKIASIDSEITRRQAEQAAARTSVEKLQNTIPLVRERVDAYRTLAEQGMVARLAYAELQQHLIEHEHDLIARRHLLAEVTATIATLRQQRQQAEGEFRRGVLAQLAEAETRASSLAQELVKADQRHGLQRLTAPNDGMVHQLALHTVGGVVTPAQPLMVIVPSGVALEIEAQVLNRDIGFVRTGQPAEIKVEAFPFTRYGTILGEVTDLSSDAVQDEKLGLVYSARVAMSRTSMSVDGKDVRLSPGMAVTVEIQTDQRRLIEYLLSPLLRYKQESLRER